MIILGCYRKGEAEDPEVYVRALVAVLSDYPEAVVKTVSDPRTGVAGRSKWLPTVSEVREACEGEMAPIYAERRREVNRQRLASLPAPATHRLTREELLARYPDIGFSRKTDAWKIPFDPPDYHDKPCTLSPAALHAIGLDQREESEAET